MRPAGPFDLGNQNAYFGGWTTTGPDKTSIVMAFPVEGWRGSAAVILRQGRAGAVDGVVHSFPEVDASQAWTQAQAIQSLDIDAQGWPAVGQRDPVIGALQKQFQFLRPVLFYSPYEAACAFLLGHRISTKQRNAIRDALARTYGEAIPIDGVTLCLSQTPGLAHHRRFQGCSTREVYALACGGPGCARGLASARLSTPNAGRRRAQAITCATRCGSILCAGHPASRRRADR